MTTLTTRPMRLLFVEFNELYARHLCRHSQLGINVVHLIALFAIWYAVYGLLYCVVGVEWALAVPALAYLAAVAPNVSLRVLAATILFLGLIVTAVCFVPAPWWVNVAIIPVSYKLQAWSHRYFTIEFDMTEFNKKYVKGRILFVVLLIYEVPIVLNFLLIAPGRAEPVGESTQLSRLAGDDQERATASVS